MQEEANQPSAVDRDARTLVVLLHGYLHKPEDMNAVEAEIIRLIPRAVVYKPDLKLGKYSCANPNALADRIAREIDRQWHDAEQQVNPFEQIILVGHSAGALLARKVYVIACGQAPDAPFEPHIQHVKGFIWAGAVNRIVLLAAMNRGWRINHSLNKKQALIWSIGSALGKFIELTTPLRLFIFGIRRGADFLTNLRVQWLRMSQRAERSGNPGNALTVQLLGTTDDMVSPLDNVDLVAGRQFIYLDVPYSGHADVIDFADPTFVGEYRRELFALALTGTSEELKHEAVIPDDRIDTQPDPSITDVVFVIHGIRDGGYWTHKLARRIRKKDEDRRRQQLEGSDRKFATETSSYGYFPMLPFLFAWKRREKVEWLMDQYAEAVAAYPQARYHFVGHSNGTYCLARALELYACCRFDRVVFAGSVVRKRFNWRRYLEPRSAEEERRFGKVGRVRNYVADSDWVVAWFPNLFQSLRIPDLGSAGHDGFSIAIGQGVENAGYVGGSHGAAIVEHNWDAIADFIIDDEKMDSAKQRQLEGEPNHLIALLGKAPIVVWLAIGFILSGMGWLIASWLLGLGVAAWIVTLVIVVYTLMIWAAVTRL